MLVSMRYRVIISVLVAVLGLAWMLPSFMPKDTGLSAVLPEDQISLGLDLKGGVHLTLGVDVGKAAQNTLGRLGDDIRAMAREDGIVVLHPDADERRLTFTLLKPGQQEALDGIIDDHFDGLTVDARTPGDNGKLLYSLSLTPEYRKYVEKLTVDQAVKTIRNRIDKFGVSEPDIRRQEGNRIQVQLPGLDDPQRAIRIIGQTAHLEFKLVDDDVDIEKAQQGILPPGRELSTIRHLNADGTYLERPIVVHKEASLTGEYITDARTSFDNYGRAYVSMNFDSRGGRIFSRLTGENVKKRLAIVLDGKVYSAPVIQDKISGGRAQITGNFTTDEAHDLALVLRSGSLPAPVNVLEERAVGPSLGQESIDKGIKSAVLGMILVMGFMVLYYGFGGLVANLVLVLNIVLILAGLSAFGATLTLPGIAGIILTIGMAVDANVLIFERIREELRRGLTPKAAIAEGYGRATLTILDANVTTVIAAIVLYQFGTGPIRGFAVTLTLGILASMFTAIFVSRILFDVWGVKIKKPVAGLSIIKPDINVNFIGKRKAAFLASGLIILLGLASLAVQGGLKKGIDFAGGAIVQVKFTGDVPLEAVQDALSGSDLDGLVVQRFGQEGDNEYLIRTSAEGVDAQTIRSDVEQALGQGVNGAGFTVQRQEMVGPKVGKDLRSKALEALFYSVLLIAIYISGRFEQRWMASAIMAGGLAGGIYVLKFLDPPMSVLIVAALAITLGLCWKLRLNYALGAVVALIHDVLITVGLFSVLGKEFDLTIVAALLTIVGYSLNDTIIVFDRIRENLRAKVGDTLGRTINIAINQTLSRTLITSCTTLIVVTCLFLFGGGVIHDFAFALLVGIGVGTYSSIFVASPILLGFKPRLEEGDGGKAPAAA